MTTSNEKNLATVLHLSALTQYIIPFGNYIFPIVIWSSKKDESEFLDANGKQILNFQLSIFVYSVLLCMIAIPIIIYTVFKNATFNTFFNDHDFVINDFTFHNLSTVSILGIIAAFLFFAIKVIEFALIINAAVKSSNGEVYRYPLTIPFFK
eukprot:GDKJ01022181.1.p1 GENE.GDKJ01022181.1~~GDKJ01022181.1.p1  ORF type:complete len:152 (+),score=0.67 GDKJ01022181.1:328-783(+)